ncbi:YCF48-related protein [Pontimicrobium sp. IMCC45349]|uniref:YCF48-related protein n=1 Tax=Pontimicrobium sp. IMCC45349 TaxID=3391574 RepID=UPI0039A0191C
MKFATLLLLLICFNLNAQANWQPIPEIASNTNNQRFDDVFFLNDNLGWAANGYYAAVYKTTDGGITWTEQLNEDILGGSFYFRNIEFLNENVGFLGTLNGIFFKTTDGGNNWTPVIITPNPPAICGLDAIGNSTIYGCGAYFTPAHIIKSTDSGDTWQHIDMSTYADALVEVLFLDELTGYASGQNNNGGVILKTTDGGATWTELLNTNIPGEYVWKLQTLEGNPNIMFGSVSSINPHNGKLIKSIDAGVTWSSLDAPETNVQAVGFITENHGWMGGHSTGFYETLDGGISWTNLNIGSNLNRILIINSGLAYACGTTIYKFTDENLGITNFQETNKENLTITLHSNPVENDLEFTIHFNSDDNILITLYDINGKYIKQLTRDIITTKTTKSYSFPVDMLASGIYILDFHNNTGRSSLKFTKK